MTEHGFLLLKSRVFEDLDKRLSPKLTYHSRVHTEDVLFHTERIAILENVNDPRTLLLLRLAALFHDTGFIFTYKGHEERSCQVMAEWLGNSFSAAEIEQVSGMIMATKMPQSPSTLCQMILCDADLDYLGREDFPVINKRLKEELMAYRMISNNDEWHQLQISFLENHRYFTHSSLIDRTPVKETYLRLLKKEMPNRIL
jgi:uncharacterized protein